jgi:uncharacterized protein with PIN domain
MSQWTHVLGVVRFDSMNKNVWPEPPNKEALVKAENDLVNRIFQESKIPAGSEGPIELQTIITGRGPTVLLTGDLRDFGKEDLGEIVTWLNGLNKKIKEEAIEERRVLLIVRDAMIYCDVEFDNNTYLIMRNEDIEWDYELKIFPVSRTKPDGYACQGCGTVVPAAEDGSLPEGWVKKEFPERSYFLCPKCQEDFRFCRVCGCSDEDACEGGCYWVEEDLCSACVGKD